MSEKQRAKLEKFAAKQAKTQQAQQQPKKEKANKPGIAAVGSKDWVDKTPAGQKKILQPLDDDFHKAYIPNVVESAWYSWWEEQGLFKPRTKDDGSLKPRGAYVIAIPPPNVRQTLRTGCSITNVGTR